MERHSRQRPAASTPVNDNTSRTGCVAPGSWNRDPRTGELRRTVRKAIAAASATAPDLAALAAWVLPRLPGKPLCSRSLKCGNPASYLEPLVSAIHAPWISWNTDTAVNALTVDCDHDDLDLLEDLIANLGLPRPAFVVIDPWTGRFHVTWFLATPVLTGPDDNPKPKALLRRALALLIAALKGDPDNVNRLTKNPWGRRDHLTGAIVRKTPCPMSPDMWALIEAQPTVWRTIDYGGEPVELKAIVAALADDYSPELPARRHRARKVENGDGRNCTVFDRVRLWAYDNVARYGGGILWREALEEVAREANDFAEPLDPKELQGVVRSVYKFTTSARFRPRGDADCARGAMDLPPEMDTHDKQVLSGPWSAAKNKADTDKRVLDAALILRSQGVALTRPALAGAAGISVSSLRGARWTALQAQIAALPADEPVPAAPPAHEPPRPVLVTAPAPAQQAARPPRPVLSATIGERIAGPNTAERRAADYEAWRLARLVEGDAGGSSSPSRPQRPPVPGFLRRRALSAAS